MRQLLLFIGIISSVLAISCTPASESEGKSAVQIADLEDLAAGEDVQARIVHINLTEYQEKKSQLPEAILIDARTPAEFAQGHIPGAINLDVKNPNFAQEIQKLDPEKTYLVNCKTGIRSMRACTQMQEQGFTSLYNLEGGFVAWEKAGLEVEKP